MGRRKRDRRDYILGTKKFACPIDKAKIEKIDHKDFEFLRLFTTEKGKILPVRTNFISAKNQKSLARAIKRARDLALMPFTEKYIASFTEEPVKKTENASVSKDIEKEAVPPVDPSEDSSVAAQKEQEDTATHLLDEAKE